MFSGPYSNQFCKFAVLKFSLRFGQVCNIYIPLPVKMLLRELELNRTPQDLARKKELKRFEWMSLMNGVDTRRSDRVQICGSETLCFNWELT